MQIKTAGELRGFLADIMVGIRDGKVNAAQANAISKVAAQINQSLSVEVNTALQLERMGKDRPIAGTMLIGAAPSETEQPAAPSLPAAEPDDAEADRYWAESAEQHIGTFEKVSQIDDFVAHHSDTLDYLMESRPVLHGQVTAAIDAARERLSPRALDKIDHKLRDDLQWCEQCDMMVAPEDSAGCKSRYCSLKATA